MSKIDLILVMPAYNEEEAIEKVVEAWHTYFSKELPNLQWQILVVNDGSKDRTGAILDQLSEKLPHLQVMHQKNQGHGNSVLNGYEKALRQQSDYIFQTDSDHQLVPEDFMAFWSARKNSPFILGNRVNRKDPFIRLMVTLILRFIILLRFRKYIPDSNIPYRLMKTSFLQQIMHHMPAERPFAPNVFLSVLAAKNDVKLMNLPVQHLARETGEVSIKKWKLFKVLIRSWSELLRFKTDNGHVSEF